MRPRLPYRGWLLDLDGTVYLGDGLIPGADVAIATLRAAGCRVAFLSNKPLQTPAEYAAKLTRLGIPAAPDDVINSSLVLARYLRDRDPGAPCSSSASRRCSRRWPSMASRCEATSGSAGW